MNYNDCLEFRKSIYYQDDEFLAKSHLDTILSYPLNLYFCPDSQNSTIITVGNPMYLKSLKNQTQTPFGKDGVEKAGFRPFQQQERA
ncbi:MAG TPA: hypothetical protein ENG59_01575 [Chloroflexi bacterium]|nr:MAG: hypothetical protein DRI46_00175 [Chloroflexota bacterium]HDD54918.1 hypothetical protein [Chloroflexota bacterium]